MRRHWVSTSPATSAAEVALVMRVARLRQIPVEEQGVLVGVLDHRRLMASALEHMRSYGPNGWLEDVPVAAVMDPHPSIAAPEDALVETAGRMSDAGVGCLPVVDGAGRMVGLVIESDLLGVLYRTHLHAPS